MFLQKLKLAAAAGLLLLPLVLPLAGCVYGPERVVQRPRPRPEVVVVRPAPPPPPIYYRR